MWMSTAIEEASPPFLTMDIPIVMTGDIEKILSGSSFDTTQLFKDSSGNFEGKRAIPMMTVSFHRHLFDHGMIPDPDNYLSEYETENSNFLSMVREDDVQGIRLRVMRAYPSLVRDVHFVSSCREMGCTASRTVRDDIDGIDARIPISEREIKVRLYYESPASRRFKMRKAFSHIIGPDHYDLGLSRKTCLTVGDFLLYSREDVTSFLSSIGAMKEILGPADNYQASTEGGGSS